MPAKIELGTLIHGTLRNEDLLPAFRNELHNLSDGQHPLVELFDRTVETEPWLDWYSVDIRLADIAPEDQEYASELVNDLMDALNEYAPDGCYFGSIEGDGSDFGFWADEEDDEDIATGKCNQCDSATINGVYCHEQGCPNS